MGEKIRLATVIQELRAELLEAVDEGKESGLQFELGEIQLDLQVVVTDEDSGKGSVKFWVVNAEAGGKATTQQTQKISMKLSPKTAAGGSVKLAG